MANRRTRCVYTKRDSQKEKLYAAEHIDAWDLSFSDDKPTRLIEMQAIAKQLSDTKLWTQTFRLTYACPVEFSTAGGARGGYSGVRMPGTPWGNSRMLLLHEISHHVEQRALWAGSGARGFASHGPEFARVYYMLVREHLGLDVGRDLLASFDAHRVRLFWGDLPVRS